MNDKLISKLDESKFGNNKYYKEIIKEFISEYQRVTISSDLIEIKENDQVGSKNICFSIREDGNLVIKVNRSVDLMKFQDIIVYDNQGIMMERINSQAKLKKDINEKFKNMPDILVEEFNELGQHPSIYTGQIFKNINLRIVKRPDNFGLDGLYSQKNVSYDERGLMNGKIVEGTFKVLNSSSINTLDFPNESDINITREEILDDDNVYGYPNSRSL